MRKPKMSELDALTLGYVKAMMFTDLPDVKVGSGEFVLTQYHYSRIDGGLLSRVVKDCAEFQTKHSKLIEEGGTKFDNAYERAGMDFHYTRNGHGCGFWDGDWPDPWGDELTKATHEFGQIETYWHKGRMYA